MNRGIFLEWRFVGSHWRRALAAQPAIPPVPPAAPAEPALAGPPAPPASPDVACDPPAPAARPFPVPMPDVAAILDDVNVKVNAQLFAADAKLRSKIFAAEDRANAFAFAFAQGRDRDNRDADRNYRDGSRNLDRGEWDKAAENFSAVIEKKGDRTDGAYYWKAYALGKMGKRDEAVNLINELERNQSEKPVA